MGSKKRRKGKKSTPGKTAGSSVETPAAATEAAEDAMIRDQAEEDMGLTRTWFWVLVGVAFAVRVISLGRADLWGDEIIFVQTATPPLTPLEVYTVHFKEFLAKGHFPLPAMVNNVILWLAKPMSDDLSRDAFFQRLPNVLWGSFTVPLLYLLIRRLGTKTIALYGTGMFLFFYYPVHYSREAYVYSPLLFCTTAGLLVLFKVLQTGVFNKKEGLLYFLSLTGACYCHITGALFSATLLILGTIVLIKGWYPKHAPKGASWHGIVLKLWLLSIGSLLTVAPWFGQQLGAPGHPWPGGFKPHENLYDLVGKIFMGTGVGWVALGAVLLVLGYRKLAEKGDRCYVRFAFLLVGTVCFIMVFYGSIKTQYTPRYFYLVAGFLYALLAFGLDVFSTWIGDKIKKDAALVGKAILGVLVAVHVIVYLPNGYALTAKAKDFGRMADWLLENLEPGSAYAFESGYDRYFVPGYFPTPGLFHAVPYIHRASEDPRVTVQEMEKLRELQRRFFIQFPDAVYVENSRHGMEKGAPYPIWEWPHKFFKNVTHLTNEPLLKLINLGIYPPIRKSTAQENEYITPFWYNTPQDVESIWRENNRPVLITYPRPWNCTQINQQTFARIAPPPQGMIQVKNLTDTPMEGIFKFTCGMAGANRSYPVELSLNGKVIYSEERWPNQLWTLDSTWVQLPPGEHQLTWGVQPASASGLQNLVMVTGDFIPKGALSPEQIKAMKVPEQQPPPSEPAGSPVLQWEPPGGA